MKGRKPKPVEQHKAEGTYRPAIHGKRKAPAGLLSEVPPAPDHLPAVCLEDWRRVCHLAINNGVLTAADLDAVARYCVLCAIERKAQADVLANGLEITTETATKANPSFRALIDAAKELRAIGERLGFDPPARQKMNIGGNEQGGKPESAILKAIRTGKANAHPPGDIRKTS